MKPEGEDVGPRLFFTAILQTFPLFQYLCFEVTEKKLVSCKINKYLHEIPFLSREVCNKQVNKNFMFLGHAGTYVCMLLL